MARAKLRSKDSPVEVDPSVSARLSAPAEEVVVLADKEEGKNLLGTVAFFASMFLVAVIVLYVSLAATLIRFVPMGDGEFLLVRSETFLGGIPESGEQIFVSMSEPADNSAMGKLRQATGVPDAAVLTVIAGPHGTVYNDSETGELIVNDVNTGSQVQVPLDEDNSDGKHLLLDEYLSVCISGACEANRGYLVPQSFIIGAPTSVEEVRQVSPLGDS